MNEPSTDFFADMFQPPPPELVPTAEQEAIICSRDNPLKVLAFAGSGKTSTLEFRAKRRPDRSALYLAFNKSVEEEAKRRFPPYVLSRTVHALAWDYIGRKYRLGKLSAYQVARFCDLPFYDALLVIRSLENWFNSADAEMGTDHIARDFMKKRKGASAQIVDTARKVWNTMQQGKNESIPMTHSGYLKLFQLHRPILPYKSILLDEFQDSNPVTQSLVMSQAEFGAEIILVGDEYQAIYGWRGASNALAKTKAATLYLTQSFRFGQPIADVANTILRTYYNEPRSIIGTGKSSITAVMDPAEPYTIISRTNSFLFKRAYELCRDHRLYIAGSTATGDLPIFGTLMDVFYLWRNERNNIRDPEVKCFASFGEAKELAENECLDPEYAVAVRIVDEFNVDIPNRIDEIKLAMLHSPTEADVVLTTTHKAKGLEWNRVVLGEDFPRLFDRDGNRIPAGFQDSEINPEEINLLYVAATRAKRELQLNPELRRLVNGDFRGAPKRPEGTR